MVPTIFDIEISGAMWRHDGATMAPNGATMAPKASMVAPLWRQYKHSGAIHGAKGNWPGPRIAILAQKAKRRFRWFARDLSAHKARRIWKNRLAIRLHDLLGLRRRNDLRSAELQMRT